MHAHCCRGSRGILEVLKRQCDKGLAYEEVPSCAMSVHFSQIALKYGYFIIWSQAYGVSWSTVHVVFRYSEIARMGIESEEVACCVIMRTMRVGR